MNLRPGDNARIVRLHLSGRVRHRLADFGFRPGEIVTMVKQAPLADPIEFRVRGSHISLRRSEAARVDVELVTTDA